MPRANASRPSAFHAWADIGSGDCHGYFRQVFDARGRRTGHAVGVGHYGAVLTDLLLAPRLADPSEYFDYVSVFDFRHDYWSTSEVISAVFRFLRPWFWLPAVAVMSAGHFSGLGQIGFSANWFLALLLLGPGLCAFAETLNDLCDQEFDSKSGPKKFLGLSVSGGSGVPQGGRIPAFHMTLIMLLCGALSLLTALALPSPILLLTAIAIALAYSYSKPPLRLKEHGALGVVAHVLGYGPISYFIGYFATGSVIDAVPLSAYVEALLLGLWVGIVGMTADMSDFDDDRRLGIRTLVVRLGLNASIFMVVATAWLLFILKLFAVGQVGSARILQFFFGVGLFVYSICLLRVSRRKFPAWLHFCTLILECWYPFL